MDHILNVGYDNNKVAQSNTVGEQGFGIIEWGSIRPDKVWIFREEADNANIQSTRSV